MADEEKLLEHLRWVTTELRQAHRRLRELEEPEPIAVVAMAGRFPGGVTTPEQLWDLVAAGTDATGPFPTDRGWDLADLYDPDPDHQGTSYSDRGGFLTDAGHFDPTPFGISPREALAMDPQQRLLLETTWEVFERAGIDAGTLRGSRTGVFVGTAGQDYASVLRRLPAGVEGYVLTGTAASVISGRLAYTFGLEGPAVTIDTACSSSLVALHLAAQALRDGECTLAVAGGASVMATPGGFVEFSRQRGLAADGRCKAFSAAADGTGWAEGAGLVLVERLSDARRNGHPVLAVIRGSAVNSDGASSGLTAPNGPAQQRVIREALANAGLTPADVDAVEAHGTGTTLGDPIEAQALLATYGRDRDADRPLRLGSLKSNLGHTQAAAGVAGVMKMVLALRHGLLPATLHADEPTPHVDWSAGAVALLTEPRPWPADPDRVRRAAVSSFGMSGTNAHLVIEEAPAPEPAPEPTATVNRPVVPVLLSAADPAALAAQAGRWASWLDADPAPRVRDVAYASVTTRTALDRRAVLTAGDPDGLRAALRALAAGEPSGTLVTGEATDRGPTAMLFSGQGAQRAGMGRELYAQFPVFAAALDEVCAHLDRALPRPLKEVLFDDGDLLDQTAFTQAGLFAVEVALFRLVESFGVTPDLLAGHSIGEVTAAHLAGVLSLEHACLLVAARGALMQALPAGGGMLAVAAGEERVRADLDGYADRVGIAAVNGPSSVVVSGAADALDELAARWTGQDVRVRRLAVSHAFHSPLMEPMLDRFRAVLARLSFAAPTRPVVSNLTGALAEGDDLRTPDYWVRHVREAVRYADGVTALRDAGADTFLEIGPRSVLTALTAEALPDTDGVLTVATQRRDRTETEALLAALAELHTHGVPVDWTPWFADIGARPVDLPTYAFQRARFWPDAPAWQVGDVSGAGLGVAGHPLLGAAVRLAGDDEVVLTGRLSRSTHSWLADHVVAGAVVVPGTALLELVVRAGDEVDAGRIRELTVAAPLTLPAAGAVRVQVRVGAADDAGARPVTVHAQPDDDPDAEWVRHAEGLLEPAAAEEPSIGAWPPAGASEVDVAGWYDAFAAHGLTYGPVFRGVRRVLSGPDEAYAEVTLPDGADPTGFGVHPALLDAALHPIGLLDAGTGDGPRVPFAFEGVQMHAAGARVLRVRLTRAGASVRLVAVDAAGAPVVSVDAVTLREFSGAAPVTAADRSLYALTWPVEEVPAPATAPVWAALRTTDEDPADLAGSGASASGSGDVAEYPDVAALVAAVAAGAPDPGAVLLRVPTDPADERSTHDRPPTGDGPADARPTGDAGATAAVTGDGAGLPDRVRAVTTAVLGTLQDWLAADALADSRLVVLTRGAVAAIDDDRVTDLTGAAVWGLLRSAQSEHPGRIVLADLDREPDAEALSALAGVVADPASTGGQVALRGDAVRVPRLARPADDELSPPDGPWHLAAVAPGTLDGVAPVRASVAEPGPGQVRIAVRATGVNFRDVLIALGMYPDPAARMGSEGAGVVLAVGPDVTDLAPGDRVLGMFEPGFGPEVLAARERVARVPAGWSFTEAASVPLVFLTAWYALRDLADLRAGESVLIHSGAGGVGMAAIQIAHHLGATVYATASPAKWDTVRGLGVAPERIASSRTTEFEGVFAAASDGAGVDVVLDALAGEFVDASLRLLPRGGRFIEMGKTDLRDPEVVAREHPGVAYRSFDLNDAGGARIGAMLGELLALFERGALSPLPVRAWDVRQARTALRHLSQARHVGKVVLTVPAPVDSERVTLVTGASGALAGIVARHLVASGQSRNLLLAARRSPADDPAYAALVDELTEAGATVRAVAVDLGDADRVVEVVAGLDLTAVYHCAGVVADATIASLDADAVDRVLRPKVDAAWALHRATAGHDLSAFVLFSSFAATLGSPGQGNYAAANAYLDALAAHRHANGLPATSIGWGMWATDSAMTAHLDRDDARRLRRLGMTPLTATEGAALLDAATRRARPAVAAATLRLAGDADRYPAILRGLARTGARRAARSTGGDSGWAERLAGLAPDEATALLVDLVRAQAAAVLGHASAQAVPGTRAFKDLGFDSLTSVELRNRLASTTGLRLPATLVFDHPTPERVAGLLHGQLAAAGPAAPATRTTGPARADEPLAVIGMACRYPGGIATPEQLWDLVAAGGDAIGGFPADRGWDLDALYDPDTDRAGTSTTRHGGFLADAGHFDPAFFGISPREALAMDPQQRLLLETAWEAFESAGIDPATRAGSATGVFVGAASSGYAADGAEGLEGHLLTGTAGSVASGRLAYTFGLEGPAVTVDTACSSSLVALHLAAQALRSGECDLALAGGVALMATPGMFSEFSRQGGLAPDGRCKAFAAGADGTGWGEGAGILLVQRLADAHRDGHRVLAVVRGTAINSDGASNGLTAPNGPSQQRVIRAALANARLSPADVDVVEAHGTGTTLGDPIEAQALLATYGQDRPADRPLLLGSIKSNIGHTQAAAGVAGIIKMVLAMRHGVVPPTLHVDAPSSHIDWTAGAVTLVTDTAPWPVVDRPRRAAVSSFGISGTNAHAVIEAAPAAPPAGPAPAAGPGLVSADAVPLLLSARGARALPAQAARLREHLDAHPDLDLVDVGRSLATDRAQHPYRQVTVAAGRTDALAALADAAPPATPADGTPKVVFVFPGQGSQWPGMALDLLDSSPVFRDRMRECAAELAGLVDWTPEDVLRGAPDAPPLDRVDVVQPLLFAVMVSLAEVWRSCGVRPDAVIGHSQGEIAAACVAGALTLPDAMRLVVARSRALLALSGRGGMVSVPLSAADTADLVAPWGDRLGVAALNGATVTVVSGDADAVDELLAVAADRDLRARRIAVDYASHCAHVDAVRDELADALGTLEPRPSRVVFHSTVTGEPIDTTELDAGYWFRNLREPVRLAPVVDALIDTGHRAFVEISPHPVLKVVVQDALDRTTAGTTGVVVGSLRRDEHGPRQLLTALGGLHTAGVPVDWAAVFAGSGSGRVDLPPYAFQRERFWPEPGTTHGGDVTGAGLGAAGHPLLGAAVRLADADEVVLTGRLSLAAQPWLTDHAVAGTVLLPGTALVELAVRAGDEVGAARVRELTLVAPLALPDTGAVRVQVRVGAPDDAGARPVTVHAQPDGVADDGWTRHAEGVLEPATAEESTLDTWPPAGASEVDLTGWYDTLAGHGLAYGPAFRGLRRAWTVDGAVCAEVALPDGPADRAGRFEVHPALLDAALHAIGLLSGGDATPGPRVPFTFGGVQVHAAGAAALRVRLSRAGDTVRLVAADETGAPVVSVDELVLKELGASAVPAAADRSVLEVAWSTRDVTPADGPTAWAVLAGITGPDAAHRDDDTTGDPDAPVGTTHSDVAALVAAVEAGAPAPDAVLLPILPPPTGRGGATTDGETAAGGDLPDRVRSVTLAVLAAVRTWLAADALADSRLVVTTRGATAARDGDRIADLAGAAAWGLLRSAQSEHPGRIVLADLDRAPDADALALLAAAPAGGQVALRDGDVLVPRVVRPAGDRLVPSTERWHVAAVAPGTIDGVALRPTDTLPLAAGEVRVAVRAAGVNFRDVLIALGMYPDVSAVLGSEGAGVVREVGPGVSGLAVGDRVFGLFEPGFGPEVVARRDRIARVPGGWSFVEAASVPVVFLTAWYALRDLADLRAGESVLIHSGTGGVGMAAIQIARHLGATVYATASPAKWDTLRSLGVADERIASSRTTEFARSFAAASGGAGVDVVLDALAGEFVDASLRLLPRGGRFVEMGKTDVRDPDAVAAQHPGVTYRAFELNGAGGERLGGMLTELLDLFETGALTPLPTRTWDVRQARTALRHLSQARHVGKVVLTVPVPADPDRVTLVTGASGTLAGIVARHLVATGRTRNLLLAARRSPADDPAYAALVAALTDAGATVHAVPVDLTEPGRAAELVAGVDLTAVYHCAGTIADATVTSLDAGAVERVLRPKVDAAWALHQATAGHDLAEFVLFSSVAATLGSPGQGNYAAANAFLDALAAHRRATGLPAASLAWGLWATTSTMTAHLDDGEHRRAIRAGSAPLTDAEGLALLDAARRHGGAHAVLMNVPAGADPSRVPELLRDLIRPARRRAAARTGGDLSLADRLATLSPAARHNQLLDLVAGSVAAVLGHRSADGVDPHRPFKELGFDSLTSVELRNRLAAATGLRLPATVAFDHPTPVVLAEHLDREIGGRTAPAATPAVTATTAVDEPIAVVGMACRFPGDVRSPEDLWDLVTGGADAIAPFPTDRGWDLAGLGDGDDRPAPRHGGFLYDAADFDAAFFGINPREALAMDPQQRLLLETSWEALERAGVDPAGIRGSSTGVYVGLIYHDYAGTAVGADDDLDGYVGNGSAGSVASGRISYLLGLEGPAVTVDTACSSSLVALHLAAQALRQQECGLALAGGVTVMSTPGMLAEFSRQRGLSPDGRCKAFGADADGTGFAEGVGMLLLQRLSDARRDGRRILAVLRGSAVNQDGASSGLTAPNGPSQQRVIRAALANARLSPADVDVVEAHGTGTALGDPIEAQALLATYGQDRDTPLLLGSVKSNIGHTQAAAGVAGIIKMVLAMRHGIVPPTLHADEPSPHVDWTAGAITLATATTPWPAVDRPRRAAVSSFGISGTNVHAILEQAPEPAPAPTTPPAVTGDLGIPCVLSARTPEALRAQADRLAAWIEANPAVSPADLGHALATARSAFEHRAVLLPRDRSGLLAGLAAVTADEPSSTVVRGTARTGRLAVLFSGQGAQRPGMGREAYRAFPVFAAALDEVCRHLDPLLPRPLRPVLFAPEGAPEAALLDRTEFTQPALFAVEVALFRLVESFGITPDLVGGHSVGEITAAYVAGVLSLPDAAALVTARGRLMQALPDGGGMLAVAAPEDEVTAALAGYADRVGVAAVNGPSSVVVSGASDALDELAHQWRERGVRTRRLRVSHAFHSPLMAPMLADFRAVVDGLTLDPPRLPVLSNLTGRVAEPDALRDPDYWVRHVRDAVRFADGIADLRRRHVGTYLEVGPDGVLAGMIRDCLGDDAAPVVVPTLRAGRTEGPALLTALAEAYAGGVPVDWTPLTGAGAPLDLPTYPFQRRRFWPDATGWRAGDLTGAGLAAPGHPLLGAAVRLAGADETVLTGRLAVSAQPWLAEHVVAGAVLLPGTALVELVVRAGDEVGAPRVRDLTVTAPLVLPATGGVRVQVRVGAADDTGGRDAAVYAQPDDDPDAEWTRHAEAVLEPAAADEPGLAAWPPAGVTETDLTGWYETLVGHGLTYGPTFQGLRRAWTGRDEVYAEVALPDSPVAGFAVHPALLDAALHPIGLLPGGDATTGPRVPFAFEGVQVHATGARLLRVRLSRAGAGVRLVAVDETGAPVVSVDTLVLRELAGAPAPAAGPRSLYAVTWPVEEIPPADADLTWAALAPARPAGADADRPVRSRKATGRGAARLNTGSPHAGWLEPAGAVPAFPDVAALVAAVEAGTPTPDAILLPIGLAADAAAGASAGASAGGAAGASAGVVSGGAVNRAAQGAGVDGDLPGRVRSLTATVLASVQAWLSADALADSRLVVLTRGAVSTGDDDDRTVDPAAAAVWGLLRSAQSEHPDRIVLVDADAALDRRALGVLAAVVADPTTVGGQLALRGDRVCVPRLVRPADAELTPPSAGGWHVAAARPGTLDGVEIVSAGPAPLAAGEVRVAVRAAGVNFRDVLIALGMYPDASAVMGSEGAGVVLEVGPGVSGLAVGDRVFGLFEPGFGPEVVARRDRIARVPDGWSFVEAASVPVVFLTAWYALRDLADLRAGESVLIHSGAGGVGMAAIQIAHHLGATVYATASPGKWGAVRGLGVAPERIASSRTTDFESAFAAASGGAGVDVVLDALAGEFVDASLRLLPRGGRFVEMGKTDLRDPEVVAREHPGVAYRSFDLNDAGGERIGAMLGELLALFTSGALRPLPVRAWDVRQARTALRHLSQARHVGKVVLTVPAPADPDRVTLVTGASGALAAIVARHLVATGHARNLLLAARRAPADDPAYAALVEELTKGGAAVRAVAVDLGDAKRAAELVAGLDLTAVYHCAGVVADATIASLDADAVDRVMRPKVDAAWALHRATAGHDLSAFVLFSSIAATLGSPGQGNYAAANAFLDALATHRHATGLPATSIGWGAWATGGMAGRLDAGDRHRLGRIGMTGLGAAEGSALLDVATTQPLPAVVAARLRVTGDRKPLPPLLRLLTPTGGRRQARTTDATTTGLTERLAGLAPDEATALLVELVRAQAAAVLGHASAQAVPGARAFKDLGFDSLTSVELRNRLASATGLRLPATLVFDHPTPERLAEHLHERLGHRPAGVTTATRATATDGDDPIAIIGMACRLPGGVTSPDQLWDLIAAGGDGIAEFPTDRGWDVDALYDPDADRAGTSTTRYGGFLPGAADFDPAFFGISPREALAMDPQQRLLLETSWEAFESAGLDPHDRTTTTGVFAGLIHHDYAGRLDASEELEGYLVNGTAGSVASGRVAYVFGLEGPAVTVDTACSSSLVALHLAGQALRAGECDLALAGGVTVMATPSAFVGFSRQRGLAPDGRCKSFAAGADGTSWGEGVGMLLVERLSDARRRGHRVLAVVRGTAVNQDGASNGLTAPNGPSQQRVIRQALANAGLSTSDVDAVEAHGTGTTLGDPIEAQALLATYGQERSTPLLLGSVKSNIGHTQAAAGVAGIIKMVLAMRHGIVPPTLHVDEPSPHIDWSAGAVSLATEATPWPAVGRPRRAAVSSFGISGTNAHVILEHPAPAPEPSTVTSDDTHLGHGARTPDRADAHPAAGVDPAPARVEDLPVPVLLSARTDAALAAQADRWARWIAADETLRPADVGWSAFTTRPALEQRAVLGVADRDGLLAALRALAGGASSGAVTTGPSSPRGRLAVLFSGQGAQRAGMGRELSEAFPAFAAAVDEVCAQLDPLLSRPLKPVLFGDGDLLNQTEFTQAGLFAVEVALFRLVESFGVTPDLVGGHSIGEVTAAHVAGVLSLADACALVAARGRLMQALPAGGGMLAVAAPEAEVAASIADHASRTDAADMADLGIAAVNGPSSVVVSGPVDALDEVERTWRERGVRTRRLTVSHAFHSPLMEPMLAEFRTVLDGLSFAAPLLPVVSNVTGAPAEPDEIVTADYWVRHVREAVRFADGVAALHAAGADTFLEIGPQSVLTALAAEILADDETVVAVAAQRRDRDETEALLAGLAELHVHGVRVDWTPWFAGTGATRVDLPTYAFQHERFWPDTPTRADASDAEFWAAVESGDLTALAGHLADDALDTLTPALPALTTWRRARTRRAPADRWAYQVTWKRLDLDGPPATGGAWLVVGPAGEPATADVAAALAGAELRPVTVDPATATRTDLAAALGKALADGPVDGVVSLLGLTDAPHPEHPSLPAGTVATLLLIQALHDTGDTPPLWCLTRDALAVDGDDPVHGVAQGGLWGLARVAGLELPRLRVNLLDLPAGDGDTPIEPARLAAALTAGGDEDQLALRSGGLHARRLVRATPAAPAAADRWRPTGTVLVTGGTGALGAHVARWAAGAGADHLVLTSRRGDAAPGAAELRDELTALGVRVTVAACDVADRDAVAALLGRLDADPAPLTAVVHAAGLNDVAPLLDTDPDRLAGVSTGKTAGAVHLDELLGDRPLDAFVLFASIAGVWGSGGQAGYAAGNAHLDALAARRHARGLAATSVAWGPWADGGMATDDAQRELARRGLRAMAPADAVHAMRVAVGRGDATLTVVDVDWATFAPAYASSRPRPFLADLPEARQAIRAAAEVPADGGAALRDQIRELSTEDRDRRLVELVRAEAAAVLGHGGPDRVKPRRAFKDLGFDSLTAVELRNRLNRATGLALPTTLVFDHPDPTALADHLRATLLPDASGTSAADPAETAVRQALATVPLARIREAGLLELLLGLADADGPAPEPDGAEVDLDDLDTDTLIRLALDGSES
ncbi:type I polyketide synthase [Micromonospora robiginosa]|uniref:Type I polyketide synthase n=1 Tax=Micromonospora robiginosa TaxID=2749844 RepID=A0AAF0P5K0_9ACTN|nr:type I polyketide synthase [Micromonospora ferruginea]WMF04528.1 type I polyketide synthase [Micromonospora ferruginea]